MEVAMGMMLMTMTGDDNNGGGVTSHGKKIVAT